MLKSLESVGRLAGWAGSACTKRVGFFAKFLGVALPFIHPSDCLSARPPASSTSSALSPNPIIVFSICFLSPWPISLPPSHAYPPSPLSSLHIASPTTGRRAGAEGRRAGLITNSNVAGRAKQRRVAFCSLRWPDRRDGPDRPTAAAAVHPSMNRSLKRREGREKGRRGGRRGEGAAAPTC